MPSGAKVRFRPILRVPTTGWCGLAYRIANSDDMRLFSGNGLKPSQKRPCFQKHYFNVSTTIGVTAVPSAAEAFFYLASEGYVRWLLSQLGSPDGTALEFLADYLMSCMPGCRTRRRARSGSTDYDVVCSMEGSEVDFRSELGRYFVVESKDWAEPAGFTTMAKLCRVLDSSKAKFGILLSKNGISGVARTTDAAREQLKVYQDRGIVVVVLSLEDLGSIAEGASLIALLRKRYEAVRPDLQEIRTKKPAKQRKQK